MFGVLRMDIFSDYSYIVLMLYSVHIIDLLHVKIHAVMCLHVCQTNEKASTNTTFNRCIGHKNTKIERKREKCILILFILFNTILLLS